jgi:hypothetical protein
LQSAYIPNSSPRAEKLTSPELAYPLLNLLQTERRFGTAIILILVDM